MLPFLACSDAGLDTGEPVVGDSATAEHWPVDIAVTLDGQPAADTLVMQGGGTDRWLTDAEGRASVEIDPSIVGDLMIVAAHPEARIDGVEVDGPGEATLALTRFVTTDNEAYVFADPGSSWEGSVSSECVHCHPTLHAQWSGSPHAGAAKNTQLHDLYQGLGSFDETACGEAGGTWAEAREPGTGATMEACFVAEGVTDGTCADCHAPGIDGALGGRDLLEATGVAYESGVHCDVCHKVESIDLDAEPGVAGRLHIVRPSEEDRMTAYQPLSFGPYPDVPNPNMGSVWRESFHDAELCAGCHEQYQEAADPHRWPEGLPIHTTFGEWEAGPMNPAAPCQTCHMPPLPEVGNSADLYNFFEDVIIGVSGGWPRPPGSVRSHAWWGPRQRESGMLELAASLTVDAQVDDDELTAWVTVKNVGPGHAIPTGEPMRSLVVRVEATCNAEELAAIGGAVVPDFGGALDMGTQPDRWPGAAVGDVIRAVSRTGAWVDYEGFGPFGDGTFDAEAKGMPVEEALGVATVVAVDGDRVQLDAELPTADLYYRGESAALPEDGDPARMVAGAPGFAFARVLVGAGGERMVPHFEAVDVASDNRLLPQRSWTSEHRFALTCEAPEVRAVLTHRAFPPELARARGWTLTESVMAEANW